MKKKNFTHLLAFIMLTASVSCNGDEPVISLNKNTGVNDLQNREDQSSKMASEPFNGTGVLYGPGVNFNGTSVRSFVALNNYRPVELGYELSNAALNNLPNPATPENTEILIPLPTLPSNPNCGLYCPDWLPNLGVLFDHLTLHWYPDGSEPAGIFSFPKFDFHAFTIPLWDRMHIRAEHPEAMLAPAPEFMPSNYYGPIGPMSMMGSHWVDLLSPEFNGGAFTRTFIYGTYDAQIVFEEISVTRDYLLNNALLNVEMPIRQPVNYMRDGYYPLKYRISKNTTTTKVYFSDFALYRASGSSEM